MKKSLTVKAPSKSERITLRLMIFLGLISMGFFLDTILSASVRGNGVLYGMLMTAFGFSCLKILHEWIHYFYITVPETPPHTRNYSVDIFTTFCAGEPYPMIVETLTALQRITYPHNTYLCDEADDPYLQEVCRTLGVSHVTRTHKIDAKAGNINNALSRSGGELCVVLDPDHVPFPDFLDPIVSHFDNPEVGFVQIVQAYKNHGDGLIAKGAAQQTYQFYGPMMMTMNKYGTVQAIGANCTFRRKALESIGGHAAGLAEDMHTSMQLHAKGWKSVYVPAVLARGLVPSTLSAYYQQQLKWSRGVFDLLVTAYPKLFKHFTWQQKLHYVSIPLHYLSGVIFLINFLIPVIALFFHQSPMYINLSAFGLVILPLAAAIVLIRLYVQWWVMEDEERGFHVAGGLLMIGTWWIFITGLVYTLLGKKVPYVPTPKEGNEDSNWKLNIPNLIILGLSLGAIVYGLYTDWNPYNFAMAGFAGLNCFFMVFVILASRQQHVRNWNTNHGFMDAPLESITRLKGNFWIIRRRIYAGIRSMALVITTALVSALVYLHNFDIWEENRDSAYGHKSSLFLLGTDLSPDSPVRLSAVKSFQNRGKVHFDILTLPISWDRKPGLPLQVIDSVYKNGSVPMILWEPREAKPDKSLKRNGIFRQITRGDYDDYLRRFADQIRSLERPVYVRFAHEAINPPHTGTKNHEVAAEFIAAWQYIFDLFIDHGARNAIWVWNPLKVRGAASYFPGRQYVDWLAVSAPDDLRQKAVFFGQGLPVMLILPGHTYHPGTHLPPDRSDLQKNSTIKIQGIVLAGSSLPKALPGMQITQPATSAQPIARMTNTPKIPQHSGVAASRLKPARGVNYTKGQEWAKSAQVFTRENLNADFLDMQSMGINTVKYYGPGVYDHNILKTAKETNMDVYYGFWIPADIDFLNDKKRAAELGSRITATVEYLKNDQQIVSWNIGNDLFKKLEDHFYKPELLYQRQAYLSWLKELVSRMKKADPKRTVTLDVSASGDVAGIVGHITSLIPQIDAYGLVLDDIPLSPQKLITLKFPYFISYAGVTSYARLPETGTGVFISDWQDGQWSDRVSFDGLKDFTGRNKLSLLQLRHRWEGTPLPAAPTIKILRPVAATLPGTGLIYSSITEKNGSWMLASLADKELRFEWHLVRTDGSENPVAMQKAGTDPRLWLRIPENPSIYRLYLYTLKNNTVISIARSTLNTPLKVESHRSR
jgi:cellulose synthase (UDP-forming)